MIKKEFAWELRRGSQKDICPACGKRRFVPYVSAKDHKTPAGPEYGRCDREQNCCYHRYPGKEVSTRGIEYVPLPVLPPLRFCPAAVSVSHASTLYSFALRHFPTDKVDQAWEDYKVGAEGTKTVFWEIALNGEIRAGKIIPYQEDGHRDKSDRFPAMWCHKSHIYDGLYEGAELHQCLFGEHLIGLHPGKAIRVVESEKTALFMSILVPAYLWIACGGSCGLSPDKIKVLEERDVTLFPDNGQYNRWRVIADAYGFGIDRQTDLRPIFEGCDILDYFIK